MGTHGIHVKQRTQVRKYQQQLVLTETSEYGPFCEPLRTVVFLHPLILLRECLCFRTMYWRTEPPPPTYVRSSIASRLHVTYIKQQAARTYPVSILCLSVLSTLAAASEMLVHTVLVSNYHRTIHVFMYICTFVYFKYLFMFMF
jgi:hypothetical protein